MKKETYYCDISRDENNHGGSILKKKVPVMFDHDQEDGKSKTEPYFEMIDIDICETCWKQMTITRTLIYAYGAMGHNTYKLLNRSL